LPAAKNTTLLPFLTAAAGEFGIGTAARTAAFLAQLAHESGQFQFMEEIWGPTPAQQRYEPQTTLSVTLGNTEAGDGFRFKGRGPIQITGRSNYRRFGDLLGLDLVSTPEHAARPEVAFRIAALFWSKKGLNELADKVTPEAFREITRRINGGFHGLVERQRFYETAKAVLGVTGPVVSRGAAPVRDDVEEPVFDRGYEAILSAVPETGERGEIRETTVRQTATTMPSGRATGGRKTAARKAATRKAAAKKAAVKKTAARQTVARKAATKQTRAAKTASTRASRSGAGTKRAKTGAKKKAASPRRRTAKRK
jgi:predicted chitinase